LCHLEADAPHRRHVAPCRGRFEHRVLDLRSGIGARGEYRSGSIAADLGTRIARGGVADGFERLSAPSKMSFWSGQAATSTSCAADAAAASTELPAGASRAFRYGVYFGVIALIASNMATCISASGKRCLASSHLSA
jgi:hypothetical protein